MSGPSLRGLMVLDEVLRAAASCLLKGGGRRAVIVGSFAPRRGRVIVHVIRCVRRIRRLGYGGGDPPIG